MTNVTNYYFNKDVDNTIYVKDIELGEIEEENIELNDVDLETCDYKDLQKLAKIYHIKATLKKQELKEALNLVRKGKKVPLEYILKKHQSKYTKTKIAAGAGGGGGVICLIILIIIFLRSNS